MLTEKSCSGSGLRFSNEASVENGARKAQRVSYMLREEPGQGRHISILQDLANIFYDELLTAMLTEVNLQSSLEDLKKHLKTYFAYGWVVPSFAQLVSDEGVLSTEDFVEAEVHACLVESLPDQISSLGRNMVVAFAEDHDELTFDVFHTLQTVVLLALAQAVGVYICSEVAYCSADSLVECTAVR